MATYYFPTTSPAKAIKIAAPNPPARSGWTIRDATEDEQAQIDAGQTYWTPSGDSGSLSTPPAKVPAEIAAWRGRAIMRLTPHGDGTLYDAAVAAFEQLDPQQRVVAEEVFNGTTYARISPTLAAMAALLGLTSEQVDALFVAAAQLPG